MMSDYKLSIIIPVFNVERYLRECMESILNQNHNNCEIVLVDDGSTDGSGLLCDEYNAESISVIHKENGGPSSARNVGLEAATGKYIAFLDSDDRLSRGSIPSILKWIDGTDVDICFMDAVVFYPDGKVESLGDCTEQSQIRSKTKEEVFQHLSTRPKYPGSACTKLFRRRFLIDHNICFPGDRRFCEDLGFVLDCLLAAEKYDCLNIPYYEYRQNREGSRTTQISNKTFDGMKCFVEGTINKVCDDRKPKDIICECAMSFAAYEYAIMVWQFSRLTGEDRDKARLFLRDTKWILQYGKTRKCKLVRLLLASAGFDLGSRILDLYMNNR